MNRIFALRTLPVFFLAGMVVAFIQRGHPVAALVTALVASAYLLSLIPGFWGRVGQVAAQYGRVAIRRLGRFAIWATPYLVRFGRWLARLLGRAAIASIRFGGVAARFIGRRFAASPMLWLGIAGVLYAMWKFYIAYTESDMEEPLHIALAAIAVATVLLLMHFGVMGTVLRTIFRHSVRSWLIASAIALTVTLGHALLQFSSDVWTYTAALSGVSLLLAIITIANEWRRVGNGVWSALSFVGGFFIGRPGGIGGALLAWALACAVVVTGLIGGGWVILDHLYLEESFWPAVSAGTAGFILLFFVGFGVVLWRSINRAGRAWTLRQRRRNRART
jgi:hypothetical protein